jgi:hypothetical protein
MIDAFINSMLLVIGLLFIVLAIVTAILPRGWLGQVFTIAIGVWLGRKF